MNLPRKIHALSTFTSGWRMLLVVCTIATWLVATTTHAATNISVDDISIVEGDTGTSVATFTISLAAAEPAPISVTYATQDATATQGADYVASTGNVTFAPGVVEQTVEISIVGDTDVEGDETFTLELSDIAGDATFEKSSGVATILDDDVQISIANASGLESAGSVTATVTLSQPSPFTVTVDYATADDTALAGNDYVAASGTLTFAPGVEEQVIVVELNEDQNVEGDEEFTIELTNPVNAVLERSVAFITIVDAQVPNLSIDDVNVNEGDVGDQNTAVFTVTLSDSSALEVTVDYATTQGTATAGTDYVSTSGVLTFPAGVTTQSITVTIVGDTAAEGNETFTVGLSAAVNASIADATGEATIIDDDGETLTLVISPTTFSEGAGSGAALGTLTRNSVGTLLVELESSDTSEATVPASVTFGLNESTATFLVNAVDDDDIDGSQTVTITASSLGNPDVTATVTVTDDEQTRNLIYSYSIRGNIYGAINQPIAGNGFLVIDLDTEQVTSVVRYANGTGEIEPWLADLYTIDIGGNRTYWVLVGGGWTEVVPVELIDQFEYRQLLGEQYPTQVDLGGANGNVAVNLAGELRAGDSTGSTIFSIATLAARLDYARTVDANSDNIPHDVLVGNLATLLGITSDTSTQVEETKVSASAAATDTIALYNFRATGLEAGSGEVESLSEPGFLLVDYGTHEVRIITAFTESGNRYYEITDWSPQAEVWYTLDVGTSSYQILGGFNSIVDQSVTQADVIVAYGQLISHSLNTSATHTIPFQLNGDLWEHELTGFAGTNNYGKLSWTASIRGETINLNTPRVGIEEATQYVLINLLPGYQEDPNND